MDRIIACLIDPENLSQMSACRSRSRFAFVGAVTAEPRSGSPRQSCRNARLDSTGALKVFDMSLIDASIDTDGAQYMQRLRGT